MREKWRKGIKKMGSWVKCPAAMAPEEVVDKLAEKSCKLQAEESGLILWEIGSHGRCGSRRVSALSTSKGKDTGRCSVQPCCLNY